MISLNAVQEVLKAEPGNNDNGDAHEQVEVQQNDHSKDVCNELLEKLDVKQPRDQPTKER